MLGMSFLIIVSSLQLHAQTTVIIDSFGITTPINGGFENLTATPAANGWTTVNNGTNNWYVGTLSNCVGLKGAYIGNGSALNNNYKNTLTTVSHLYAPVTFPAGQTCITLSFTFKGQGETNADGLQVFLGSTSSAPQSNKDLTSTDATAVQLGASWYNMVGTTCTRVSITIPAAYAGTTKNLVFSWKNNSNSGSNNAATLDNVSLVSIAPSLPNCPTLSLPANNATNQSSCNPALSWNASVIAGCNTVSKYYIYFGTTTNPPLLDSTISISYTLGTLNPSTKYYWRVVPVNAAGTNTTCVTEFNFTTGSASCSVSPGGVGTGNLTGWFKADAIPAGNVSSWSTTYPSGGSAISVSAAGSPYPQSTNGNLGINNFFNYNQYVSFQGNSSSTSKVLYNTSNLALMSNYTNTTDASSFFGVYQVGTVQTDGVVYWNSGNNGMQFRGWGRIAIGSGGGNSPNASRDWVPNTDQTIVSYRGNRSSSTSMDAFKNSSVFGLMVNSESSGAQGLSFGARIGSSGPSFVEYFDGNSAENIFFNTTLPDNLMNQVHSYLGIKYGTTLSANYTASNGVTTYNIASPYNLRIIGIGRDDVSTLLQKQSHTTDDTVRIYKGTLSSTNAGNGSSFASDKSYVMIGSNGGLLFNTNAAKAESPVTCFLYSRLEREWRVTNTNYAEKFNLDIKLSAAANPSKINVADLRLLVDDDGNFGNGGTTCYYNGDGTGIVITYSNPIITITGIANTHIPVNATKYITIGSANPLTPLPVDLLSFTASCQTNKIMVNWSTASEINNQDFELQRSEDGADFNNIALIKGQVNSNSVHNYQYNDLNVGAPIIYYRLKQTDVNGQVHYSNVIKVNSCNPGHYNNYISFYPNPVSGSTLNIKYSVKANEEIGIKLYDVTGRVMMQQALSLKQGSADTKLNLPNLTKGVYFIQFNSTQVESIPQKLIKE